MKVWLADLTYTQQSVASDTVPAAIGMIAEYLEKKLPEIPKTKLGDPKDLVGTAIFLASSASNYITAQDIRVDGGFTAKGDI
jgi:NAD(P)-dependent dehydrogenase (short-subunit alcohol dehydrogenase family)